MKEKIKVEETEKYHPICPYCEARLTKINWHKVQGVSMTMVGYVAIYSCPHCHKVLTASASRS